MQWDVVITQTVRFDDGLTPVNGVLNADGSSCAVIAKAEGLIVANFILYGLPQIVLSWKYRLQCSAQI